MNEMTHLWHLFYEARGKASSLLEKWILPIETQKNHGVYKTTHAVKYERRYNQFGMLGCCTFLYSQRAHSEMTSEKRSIAMPFVFLYRLRPKATKGE